MIQILLVQNFGILEGNTVFVNSFIECEHYVTGGWSFKPNNENLVDYSSITLTIAIEIFCY